MKPTIIPRPLPGLPSYHVVASERPESDAEVARAAIALGRSLGEQRYGDPSCFVVLFSGPRARRRPWPHAHVVAARSPADKRLALGLLLIKGLLARLSGAA